MKEISWVDSVQDAAIRHYSTRPTRLFPISAALTRGGSITLGGLSPFPFYFISDSISLQIPQDQRPGDRLHFNLDRTTFSPRVRPHFVPSLFTFLCITFDFRFAFECAILLKIDSIVLEISSRSYLRTPHLPSRLY